MSDRYKFNDAIGKIMSLLIDACPEPVALNGAQKELVKGRWLEGEPQTSDEEEYLRVCAEWLKQEGLIRGDYKYVITLKGLDHFNAVPACLKK